MMEAIRSWIAAPTAQQACEHTNKGSRLGDLLAISTLAVGVIIATGVLLVVAGPALLIVVPVVLVLTAGGAAIVPNVWYYDDRPRHSSWGLSNWIWSPTYVVSSPRRNWFNSVASDSYSDSYSHRRDDSYFGGHSTHHSGGRQVVGTSAYTGRR